MAYRNGGRDLTTYQVFGADPPSTGEDISTTSHFPGIDGLRSNPVGLLEYPIGSLPAA